jgi:hypothetical protein
VLNVVLSGAEWWSDVLNVVLSGGLIVVQRGGLMC